MVEVLSRMALVTLVEMNDAEFKSFLEETRPVYAAERSISDHLTIEAATDFASSQFVQLLPQGRRTPTHFFMKVVATTTQETVGAVWYGINLAGGEAFIYEIIISPPHRRQGYATAALDLVADRARQAGCRILGLNVFAPNSGAQAVYRQAGFAVQSMYMNKKL